jgi:hypothetical protein
MSKSVHECQYCNQRWIIHVAGVRGEGKTFKTMQICHNCGSKMISTSKMFEPSEYADYEPYKSKQVKEQKKEIKCSVTEEVAGKRDKWEAVKV